MSKFVRLTCVFALGGAALFAQPNMPVEVKTTGMVGLAEDQTARLNLLNPGVVPAAIGIVCTASVSFIDGTGTVVKTAIVAVAPGTSGGVNLDSQADLSLAVGGRREIRAVFTVPAVVPPPSAAASSSTTVAACTLIPTLEVFDTLTGRTLVVLGHAETVPAAN
jgi:hypothetical protein